MFGRIIWCLAVLVVFFAIVLLVPLGNRLGAGTGFEAVEDILIYNVNDAGIGDLNGDGKTDRWTTNHSAAQWISLGGSDGTENDLHNVRLYQDPGLPGFEAGAGPIPDLRPIKVYMQESHFVIEAADRAVGGYLDIPWDVQIESIGDAEVKLEMCDTRPACHRVRFMVNEGGQARILPVPAPSDGFPISIVLDPEVDLDEVQLGAQALRPQTHSFTFRSRDRHSMAQADLGNGPLVFIGRGGARGKLAKVDPEARDEIFVWTEFGFSDAIERYGIEKNSCPGRQSAWQDVNGDGLLDLYLVCGRNGDGAQSGGVGNQLYLQQPDGMFREHAAEFGLDLSGVGTFRFLPQSQPNQAVSMLWVSEGEISLFVIEGSKFHQRWRHPAHTRGTEKVIVSDLDRDGIWDAFIFSPHGNIFFNVTEQRIELRDPSTFGLPAASVDGAIADFNGDGAQDLLMVPQGIFVAYEAAFKISNLIDLSWTEGHFARVVVLDHDGDRRPDLWILVQDGGAAPRLVRALYNRSPRIFQGWIERLYGRGTLLNRYWRAALYKNTQDIPAAQILRLQGPRQNPQAIGMSARLTIASDAVATDQILLLYSGIAESSRFSQTYFDIPFNLPPGGNIESIEVFPSATGYVLK